MPTVKRDAITSSTGIAGALALLAAKLPRTLRALDARPRLTAAEASALAVVIHGGPLGMGALAAHEQVTPASISRTVAALEAAGFVRRQRDENDGRSLVVMATRTGLRVFEQGHQRKLAPLVEWVNRLNASDRTRLAAVQDLLEAAATLATPGDPQSTLEGSMDR